MDTLLLTTKPDSETAATKPAKTAKRDRKAAPVTKDAAPVTVKDPEPTAQEPEVPDSTAEASAPTVTEPKKPTKADLAKSIYDEMVAQPNPSRTDIIARFRKEAGLTTSGAASYYYKFQKESGRVVEKGPTKMGPI